jgi:alkylation response protein AidB-like acyl-CoA dehydrogenase
MTVAEVAVSLPVVDVSDERLAGLTAELASHAEDVDRSGRFPWEGLQAVHEAGILTAAVRTEHGGHGGLSAVDTVRVFRALGQGDPSTALIAAMTYVAHGAFAPIWPAELYGRGLPEHAAGPTPVNAIRAEPELGAPARGGLPATTVRRTDDGWVLNGHKGFATGSEGLAYHLVWAVSDDEQPLIGHVIVPSTDADGAPTPGIRIERTWDHLGMRGTRCPTTPDRPTDRSSASSRCTSASPRPPVTSSASSPARASPPPSGVPSRRPSASRASPGRSRPT